LIGEHSQRRLFGVSISQGDDAVLWPADEQRPAILRAAVLGTSERFSRDLRVRLIERLIALR